MNTFHKLKCKVYSDERLNTWKRAMKNREISLARPEKINAALEMVTNYRRINMNMDDQQIQTHIYLKIY